MPRYKRRETLLTLLSSYEDCPVEIEKKEYMNITEGFMQFIADKVADGECVRLPCSMGDLRVAGRKPTIEVTEDAIKGLAPDWKKTLALWKEDPEAKKNKKIIYHFNDHTGGIRYKIGWLSGTVPLRLKTVMCFKATRTFKRVIWKKIIDEKKEYRIVKKIERNGKSQVCRV